MNDRDIESRVTIVVAAYLKETKVKPEDEAVILAGVQLFANFLQNINNIANKENGKWE